MIIRKRPKFDNAYPNTHTIPRRGFRSIASANPVPISINPRRGFRSIASANPVPISINPRRGFRSIDNEYVICRPYGARIGRGEGCVVPWACAHGYYMPPLRGSLIFTNNNAYPNTHTIPRRGFRSIASANPVPISINPRRGFRSIDNE